MRCKTSQRRRKERLVPLVAAAVAWLLAGQEPQAIAPSPIE
jgi:hypothetical protein